HPRHECADPVSRELAVGLVVKPLHLWHESFEWALLFAVTAEIHFDRCTIGSKVERGLEFFGQVRERSGVIYVEMFHQRALKFLVIGPHPFGPSPPRCDRTFGDAAG